MLRIVAPLFAGLAVMATAAVHGRWTERWSPEADLGPRVERLKNVPADLGDWHGTDEELDPEQQRGAGLAGYVLRRYENRSTGEAVTMMLVVGRPGSVAVHTPDVCYAGAGFAPAADPVRVEAGGPGETATDAFWTARFAKQRSAVPVNLRVLWGWGLGGAWTAPDNPRITFARSGYLYKLYVIRVMNSADEPMDQDPSLAFLRKMLPELRKALAAEVPAP